MHQDIESRLYSAREAIEHAQSKGDASEGVWLKLLKNYLPKRYTAKKAFVVDSKGRKSDQIDIVIFDRQYSPFLFKFGGQYYVPAESVYAIFEAKQIINKDNVVYAQNKAASVRSLHRTSLPIPHAGGVYSKKKPIPIIGGILALESKWVPPLGEPLTKALKKKSGDSHLDIGCVAAHGIFRCDIDSKEYEIIPTKKAATVFIFELIKLLQCSATVPMIDIDAYAKAIGD